MSQKERNKVLKTKIALIQLKTAIQLYNKENYIAAITLAGASEEILGQLALKKTGNNSNLSMKYFFDQIAEIDNKPKPALGKIIKVKNKVKNELKHHDSENDYSINYDFKFEAEEYILGAILNYKLLTNEVPNDIVIKRFYNWQCL